MPKKKPVETFFTSIGCMDGRVHKPVVEYGRKKFNAVYGDTITEAGMDGLLTGQQVDVNLLKALKRKIEISLNLHQAKGIVVHAHQECAGNPVDDNEHKVDIERTVEVIKLLIGSTIPVVGVFVKRSSHSKNGLWEVEEVVA